MLGEARAGRWAAVCGGASAQARARGATWVGKRLAARRPGGEPEAEPEAEPEHEPERAREAELEPGPELVCQSRPFPSPFRAR